MRESEKWKWSRSVVSNPQQPHGLQPTRLLRPWDFPGKRTGVGCHCLLHQYLLGFMKHKFGKCCLFHHCFSLYHLSCRQGLLEVTSFQSQTPEMGTLLIPSYSQGITSPPGLGQVLHPCSLGPVQDWEGTILNSPSSVKSGYQENHLCPPSVDTGGLVKKKSPMDFLMHPWLAPNHYCCCC